MQENAKALSNRLARLIGHLESVKRMVENERDCGEILIQLAAVKSAINNVSKIILQEHIRRCVLEATEENDENAVEDLCSTIDKFMK
jgi:DNA-binding FrmR family transcriptional regulator